MTKQYIIKFREDGEIDYFYCRATCEMDAIAAFEDENERIGSDAKYIKVMRG